MVTWCRYDAVNMTGKLEWQNTITPLNQPFFDMTDGLFINYKWEEASAQDMARVAGARRAQVYLGIDVHGRGSFDGGGWNCDVALAAAKGNGLSAALFAPGWVYENLEKSRFQELQQEYWSKVR
jgi:mannosyl-glycoprotein endo-beta-N-acetylglucosaminidase